MIGLAYSGSGGLTTVGSVPNGESELALPPTPRCEERSGSATERMNTGNFVACMAVYLGPN